MIELGPPKQRALLAVLLLKPGIETGVDQLIESLWGEDYPAYAKNLIQKSISGLRGLLADGEPDGRGVSLEWSGSGYRLDVGNAEVDLYVYERLASAGILAAREGEILKGVRLLERARTRCPSDRSPKGWRGPCWSVNGCIARSASWRTWRYVPSWNWSWAGTATQCRTCTTRCTNIRCGNGSYGC
ncbi:winged helix-turn-helix domain-containing protein [Streptomyces sp. ISL-100]|nr:winged helix-turn-helix domain-containing protein [Streptomyces sp. ISL-100]